VTYFSCFLETHCSIVISFHMRILLGFISPLLVVSTSYSGPPSRVVSGIEKPSGRLVEVFNDAFKAELDQDTVMRLAAQADYDIDNDPFTPLVSSAWTERTPFGTINLGSRIHKGSFSTVFEIKEFPNLLIKYQAHCFGLNLNVHPLLRDAWYMNATSAMGLSPAVLFLSPPSLLCNERAGKCEFNMPAANWFECSYDQGPLRYMIMEKVNGKSLHHFRMAEFSATNGAIRFRDAMIVGIQLMRLLRKLHEEVNIVHGDIHSPNVMITVNETSREVELSLIDFGLSFNVSNRTLPESPVYSLGHHFHPFFTQWQIDGYAWGPRDDVMKGIQTIAHLMHPYDYFEMEREIATRGYRALENWKLNGDWFITGKFDPVRRLRIPDELKGRIYALLVSILRLSRSMELNKRPPYEDLITALHECYELAAMAETTTTTTSPELSRTESTSNVLM
jgi:serine/threonine protein kinase